MNSTRRTNLKLTAAFVCACGASVAFTPQAAGQADADSVTLGGLVRDFSASHPDFDVARSPGAVAGSVSLILGYDLAPVFVGAGQLVTSAAESADGNAIAPHMAQAPPTSGIDNFNILPGAVSPNEAFAARVTVLGAAVATSSYDVPVTVEVRVGDDSFEPFGPFGMPTAGNVNTGLEPPAYTSSVTFAATEAVSLRTSAHVKRSSSYSGSQENHWKVYRTIDSLTEPARVHVLRGGDPAPAVDGFRSQADAVDFVDPYVDWTTGTMDLEPNEAIYCFEFNNDLSSSAADFQDLVVLVELADDPSYFAMTTAGAGAATDVPASLGAANNGGISSGASYSHWFRNVPGANTTSLHEIEMVESGGLYTFSDPMFRPINGEGFGNEGDSSNANFTYELGGYFTHEAGDGQFLEVTADGDVWVFVDEELVIDLGGAQAGATQIVEFDRLSLDDGEEAAIRIFYANRSADDAEFTITTNVELSTPDAAELPTSAMYD